MPIKRHILFILLFLNILPFTFAQDTSTEQDGKIDSMQVLYYKYSFDSLYIGRIYNIDTVTLTAPGYDPIDKPFHLYQTLSNTGSAHKKMDFSYPSGLGFSTEIPAFSNYIITEKDIIYPMIYQPLTHISYMMGGKKEQHLDVLFSREFVERLFITLDFNIDFSPGMFQRTKVQNTHFFGNFRFNTKNERYGVNGYYFHNKLDMQENGGIVNDNDFLNHYISNNVINVNLSSAKNLIKVAGFGVSQYFNILPHSLYDPNDSTSRKRRIDIGRVSHKFTYQRNSFSYEDKSPSSSFYQPFDTLLNASLTFDSVHSRTIKNFLEWSTLGYKKYSDNIPFFLSFGAEHEYTLFGGFTDYITQEKIRKTDYSNLKINARIVINILKSSRIIGRGSMITTGYHAGDFFVDGLWKQFLGTYIKNIGNLAFHVNFKRQSADWMQEYYYSNNFRWDNYFDPAIFLTLDASYNLPFFSFGMKQSTVQNYVYYGLSVRPEQCSSTFNVRSVYASFNVRIQHLELIGTASYQTSDNSDVIHLPEFYGKLRIGYYINIVKGISLIEPSFTLHYFTAYYADAYMPAIHTFYLQNETLVGEYPYVDVTLTLKIKRANVFVGYTNLYSLTYDYTNFTTPHYPTRDSRFFFGVKWRLFK